MTLITLGPEGTFSHILAEMIDEEVILVPTIGQVFREVVNTGIPGLVPLENIEAGSVAATLDGLLQYEVSITRDAYLPVHHTLASEGQFNEIRVIYAHPQSHEQCSRKIEELGIPVIHTVSNAASAAEAAKNPDSGAIISSLLAEKYHLTVHEDRIENNPANQTRFIIIEKEPAVMDNPQKCSLIVDPGENRAGLLYDLLLPFKEGNVNLARIESRPSKRSMGSYIFFLDLNCAGEWTRAIDQLSQLTTVRHLGCYRTWEGERWK